MARDMSKSSNIEEMRLVGSVAFNIYDYFIRMSEAQDDNQFSISLWISIFDDINDDLYDGTFREDDIEESMIKCHIICENYLPPPQYRFSI